MIEEDFDSEEEEQIIHFTKADPAQRNVLGETALHWAVLEDSISVIEFLLEPKSSDEFVLELARSIKKESVEKKKKKKFKRKIEKKKKTEIKKKNTQKKQP